MKKKMEEAEFPFVGYKVSKVWHKKQGRFYACLYSKNKSQKRKTISWARFLMSVFLGRFLDRGEHVDHKNNVKSDDRIENLQILTQAENSKKSAKGRTMIDLICAFCGKSFQREKRQLKKTTIGHFCNKKCLSQQLKK